MTGSFTLAATPRTAGVAGAGCRPGIEVYAEPEKLSDGVLGTLSSDESEQRWVATFVHDREPAVTWFYDHGTGERRLLFRPFPRLVPAGSVPMTAVGFPARDGLPLHAFLTLPIGVEPRGLPLVHGGPWPTTRGACSPPAQFLANRGYAVLQVNFRGSTGTDVHDHRIGAEPDRYRPFSRRTDDHGSEAHAGARFACAPFRSLRPI